MYFSFIRPLLEYSDVVWDNCPNRLKNDIEAVQVEAARIVAEATKVCNINSLLGDLGWETLKARLKTHRRCLPCKMKHNLCPSYLSNILPSKTQDCYQLRNSENISFVHARTQLYNSSFLPSTIREWNALSLPTRHSQTLYILFQTLSWHKS